MIKTGDSVILKFSPRTREIKRYDGKVYAYESMENAKKFLRPGEKDAILMEYVPAPVRCHECRHYHSVDPGWGVCEGMCKGNGTTKPNGFCHLGERRDKHGETD